MYPSIPIIGKGLNFALIPELYYNGVLKLEKVFKDTFKTTNKYDDKADHKQINRIEGVIDSDNKIIKW